MSKGSRIPRRGLRTTLLNEEEEIPINEDSKEIQED
jgi:hypothetical protein